MNTRSRHPFSSMSKEQTSNIVYILCDDLGYGDVRAMNPARCRIDTPNLDRLAAQGMVCTDAHSGSSVCTPARYGILTGRYAWRTHLQGGVLFGFDKPLIAPDRLTVPAMLKRHGYATACMGKWHLGLDLPAGDGLGGLDYSKPIRNGPTSLGFDYFFGISASLDMPPYIWIENDRTVGDATVTKTWVREGPAHKDFEAVDVLPTLARKAVNYITRQAPDAKAGKPFFLYLPLNSPHGPIVPSKEWQGRSGLSEYGDFVMETDWVVGEVMRALESAGIADNTLLVFTSDNGCSPIIDIPSHEKAGHYPSADLRGYKADIWDGGHRVPFIASWPGRIKAGSRSAELISLTDLMATCAAIVGETLPDNAGEDSVNILPALEGTARAPLREAVVHHSIEGKFAIRQSNWKLEICPGSGGWLSPTDEEARKLGLPALQLYDMTADIGERVNVQEKHPDVVKRLTTLLEKCVAAGRSTPGIPQKNDVPVNIIK